MTGEIDINRRIRTTSRRSQNRTALVFGVFAVLLHLSLLLVPLHTKAPAQRSIVMELEMVVIPKADSQDPIDPVQPIDPEPEPLEPNTRPDPVEEVAQLTIVEPAIALKPVQGTAITAAILNQQIEEIELPETKPDILTLGVASYIPLPGNLSEPVLPYEPTVFEEMYAPVETEILDQWQDPDGTIRAVIRTASGHTLCGSLARWDPTNPLHEPVPMYRPCAGGGRRKR
jgi:hypothetical protein